MKDEIKEILNDLRKYANEGGEHKLMEYEIKHIQCYITNLQEEKILLEKRIKDLEKNNEKLKQKLNCKEYFSSTMPENIEFVILTKENYDRQQKDIELELIDYKQRNEKAIEYLEQQPVIEINGEYRNIYAEDDNKLLNILNGGDEE